MRFTRMQIETSITWIHDGRRFDVPCLDLSSTGVQVLAATRLQMGDKVQAHIPSEHNELKGLEAETEVVRVGTHEDGRQSLGLTILSMS